MAQVHALDALAQRIDSASYVPSSRSRRSLAQILKEIRFHAESRYWQYTPCYSDVFEERLLGWVNNTGLTDAEREAMLRLVPEIAFVDRDDMMTLYQTAFRDQVHRWIMDQEKLDFRTSQSNLRRSIGAALKRTWICSLTDSLDIAQFHHINRLSTHSHRPQWRTLRHFGSPQKVRRYIRDRKIARVVLVEDIVGSGQQCCDVLRQTATALIPGVPLLFVPLIISAPGLKRVRALCRRLPHSDVSPTYVLPKIVHVHRLPAAGEPPFVADARRVIQHTAPRFPAKSVFGFRNVGALVVLYTNCPNTSPPFLWSERSDWAPLFPRVSRPGS